jgi:hypothetical protein
VADHRSKETELNHFGTDTLIDDVLARIIDEQEEMLEDQTPAPQPRSEDVG